MASFEDMLKLRKKARQEAQSGNNSNAGALYNSGNASASYEDALTQRHIQLRNEKEQNRKENAESNRIRINKWFADAESAFAEADEFMSNSSYNGNINKVNNINKVFESVDTETAFVENYLKPYEGTENGANLINAFKNYKNAIENYKSNAKEQTDFASQFKNEKSYNATLDNINNSSSDEEKFSKISAYASAAFDGNDPYGLKGGALKQTPAVLKNTDEANEPNPYGTLNYWKNVDEIKATSDRLNEVKTTVTVPSKEQIEQYNEDSKAIFESEMSKYDNATYDELMKAYDNTDSYKEKQWLKIKP